MLEWKNRNAICILARLFIWGNFWKTTTYDGNTKGDISFDFRRINNDNYLTECIKFNSLENENINYNLTVSGTLQRPITNLLTISDSNRVERKPLCLVHLQVIA